MYDEKNKVYVFFLNHLFYSKLADYFLRKSLNLPLVIQEGSKAANMKVKNAIELFVYVSVGSIFFNILYNKRVCL